MRVKFVDFPKNYQKIKPEINNAIFKCVEKGDFILRDEVEQFEKTLAKYCGTKYAIGVASGTDALILSLKACGIKEGDKVITVAHTFHATVEAIVHNGAKPILIDVGEDYLMDMNELEKMLQYFKPKAVIPVHLAGAVCDMERLMALAKKHNFVIIEDACQALGAEFNGQKAGSFGLTGCFSFYPAKILGAYGDAGTVITNDEKIANKIRLLRDHCRPTKEEVVCYGFSSRLDNLQAAILNVKFRYLPEYISKRKQLARLYDRGLADVRQIKLPKSQTYQDYIIRAQKRDELFEYLKKNEIETIKGGYPMLKAPYLPMTDLLKKEALRLPIYPELKDKEVLFVIETTKEFYEGNR